MDYDVIIIGGSFAGLSAAMQLARARRRVLIVDTGTPRNRFSASSHGFPGQDGRQPAAILATLRSELAAYPTVDFREEQSEAAVREGARFRISLAGSTEKTGRRIILAYGVRDSLPDLPGLSERWGVSVLHCPYCHGYELNNQPIGVLARDGIAQHQAMLLPDWGPTTLFTQRSFNPDPKQAENLAARGVKIENVPVAKLLGPGPSLEAVQLVDGRRIPLNALFLAPQTSPSCDLAEQLNCATKPGPTGLYLDVDETQATSIPGVFAAGDVASPMPNATLAAAAGVIAGGAAHRSLIFDPDLTLGA
ncbi:NAD(P)/FAD-dependent oxidoreductase [Roseibium aggregatum]|uniref:Thioredoxin reductase n=1 Tax=Roseibium aggregatum TaxID=187304 RepID=A0A939EGV4_9HYPH|nr:NAD(P)/FAD-dependent oxidoreductase [Roseibium aggregatum]MBN9672739.1 NAD(P)/FAD-dependent oxidoreductase [Roseibium aggregatum]